MKIAYEPHPVSPERKTELHKMGYRIIDARFAPEIVESAPGLTRESIAEMPRKQVVDALFSHGIEKPKGKVGELRDQLAAIMFVDI